MMNSNSYNRTPRSVARGQEMSNKPKPSLDTQMQLHQRPQEQQQQQLMQRMPQKQQQQLLPQKPQIQQQDEDKIPEEENIQESEGKGTIQPNPRLLEENLDNDQKAQEVLSAIVKALNKAFTCFGTDETRIIKVLSGHNNVQRQAIKKKFEQEQTGDVKKLENRIKAELGGNFEELCLGLLMPSKEYNSYCINQALQGMWNYEQTLIDLICVSSNKEIEELKEQYKAMYNKELQDVVTEETNGDFQKLLVTLMQAKRENEPDKINQEEAKKDAAEIYQTRGKWGTENSSFTRIMISRSNSHLKATFEAYSKVAQGGDIEENIQKEFYGEILDAYLAMVKHIKDKHAYWAHRLHNCLVEEINTDADAVMRIVISHSELDLNDIMKTYTEKYNESLTKTCKKYLYGDFKKLLIKVLDPMPYK